MDKRNEMINKLVEAIMTEKIGDLEYIVNCWVSDADESYIKEWAKQAKIKYIKE